MDPRALEVSKLLAEAKTLRQRAQEARERRDADAYASALEEALLLEAVAARLTAREQGGTVAESMFTPANHAVATSYGRAKKSGNRLVQAAGRKGLTLDGLVAELAAMDVKTSKASLSASQRPPRRHGKPDPSSRPIRREVAKAIATLLDYPVNDKNYPAGFTRE